MQSCQKFRKIWREMSSIGDWCLSSLRGHQWGTTWGGGPPSGQPATGGGEGEAQWPIAECAGGMAAAVVPALAPPMCHWWSQYQEGHSRSLCPCYQLECSLSEGASAISGGGGMWHPSSTQNIKLVNHLILLFSLLSAKISLKARIQTVLLEVQEFLPHLFYPSCPQPGL